MARRSDRSPVPRLSCFSLCESVLAPTPDLQHIGAVDSMQSLVGFPQCRAPCCSVNSQQLFCLRTHFLTPAEPLNIKSIDATAGEKLLCSAVVFKLINSLAVLARISPIYCRRSEFQSNRPAGPRVNGSIMI